MGNVIYNPHNKLSQDLPVIYGFNNGGRPSFYHGHLLAEDGTHLGNHLCSNEGFMIGDLGVIEGRAGYRHKTFREHYPEGYRMEFVSYEYVAKHPGLRQAMARRDAKPSR